MLERIDIDRIRRLLRLRGYERWEIYAEERTLTRTTAEGRFISTRLSSTSGVSIRVSGEAGTKQFSTSRLSTEGILDALDEGGGASSPSAPAPTNALEFLEARSERLTTLVRSTWPESEGLRLQQLSFDAEVREFETVGPEGNVSKGREEWAGGTAEWTVDRDGKLLPAREELWACGIDAFLESWAERNPFRACTERIRRQTNPWPAPAGDIPIYWSAGAVARLTHHLLRAFEGDLVLDELSFLSEAELPLPIPFSIFETAPEGTVDHEGSPRRTLALLKEGRPRALACHNRAAAQLEVPSTGHCRRQSYLQPPQIGLWSPVVQGNEVVPSPLSQLTWGLGIGDFSVEAFDPSTGAITLLLTDARLIHQGELGEAVEVLRWETNLLKLLGSLSVLCDKPETFGFPLLKKGSRWVTSVTAPSAISRSVAVPGAVPPGHYW